MTVGGGIGLFVLGAILAFAVSDPIAGVDMALIGYILMGAGALGLVLGLMMMNRRTTSVTESSQVGGTTVTRSDAQTSL